MSEAKRKWCAMLAKLTAPMDPAEAAKAFVNMLPMLPGDDAAYNRDTLEAAAIRQKGDPAIPNFDMMQRALTAWCKANPRPSLTHEVAQGNQNWDEADTSWLKFWEKHESEGFSNVRGAIKYPGIPDHPQNHRRAHAASMVRRFSPNAWARVSGINQGASA